MLTGYFDTFTTLDAGSRTQLLLGAVLFLIALAAVCQMGRR